MDNFARVRQFVARHFVAGARDFALASMLAPAIICEPEINYGGIPPFSIKHALYFVKASLRVTILYKNVIMAISKKFLKNGKCF